MRPSATRTRDLGVLALATIAPIWGYSWVVTKVALDYAPPFAFAALFTLLGAVCLFVLMAALRRPLRPPPLLWTAGIALLQTTAFNGLAIAALTTGGAGKVSVLVYTMPFWLLLLAWLSLGEAIRGAQWLAVALAFSGLVLVVRPWDLGAALSGLLACAAGLAWAAGALLVKLLQQRSPHDSFSLTAWQLLFGAMPLILIAGLVDRGQPDWTSAFVACLAYSVLLSNALCWTLWVFALRALPAGAAGMGTLAVPVVGVLTAWLQLKETPTAVEGVGMALIVIALAIVVGEGFFSKGGRGQGGRGKPALMPDID